MKLLQNYSLKNINTFGVDVKAKYFTEIFSEDELLEFLFDDEIKRENKLILGGGSNTLFIKDYDGIVIKNSIPGIKVLEENDESVVVEAGAGVVWNDVVTFCVNKNFGGIENLTLIPGTVGAAPIQNIGAYGQELSNSFHSLSAVFLDTNEKKIFNKDECRFSYRSSIFKEELKNKFIITSLKLKLSIFPKSNTVYKTLNEYLSKNNITQPNIKDISKAVEDIRRSRLPDPEKIGNAGSFFKNPEISEGLFKKLEIEYQNILSYPSQQGKRKISAGWLIEKCGWKGKRVDDVGTSPDHSLVICNFGNAKGFEILDFAKRIKDDVVNKFGIILEEEVRII